jgi:Protein of unknown function (DUF3309)
MPSATSRANSAVSRLASKRSVPRGSVLLENTMSLGTILLIVLILMLVGAIPTWGHSKSWGYGPSGGLGLIVIVVVVLLLMGRI